MAADWKALTLPTERALEKLRSGMSIFVSSGAAEPRAMIRTLLTEGGRFLSDLELVQVMSFGEAISPLAREARHIRLKTFFSGWLADMAIAEGRVDFIPCRFARIPHLFRSGLLHIDAAVVQVTPPNQAGYCSFGVAVDVARDAMKRASLVIGEINPNLPFTFGDTFVHIDEFDLLTASEEPLLSMDRIRATPVGDKIAFNAAALVGDESCIAFSIDPLFESLAAALMSKNHLGIHSPFFTDPLMDMVEKGAVSNRCKGTHRGKSLTAYAVGTPALYEWLDHNPLVEFQSIEKVYSPPVIGRNPRFVIPIPISKVDLSGRICLQSADDRLSLCSTEALDFFDGTEQSDGGRAIFVLPSRDREGRSNILVSIGDFPKQIRMIESIRTVVTEFGVANLEGHTVRERAQALIDIAHPDCRQQLVDQAKAENILYPDQIFLAESGRMYPSEIDTERNVDGDVRVRFRGIKPSDEEGMRRLFYRFSDAAVYSRYFHSVRSMPHAKMQAYVNVDWRHILSIVGVVGERGEGRIIAEGRYICIPGTESAEVVFIVDEHYQNAGIATVIYELLARQAIERGIRRFVAEVLFSNVAMMKVFRKGGRKIKAVLEHGIYHIEIPLVKER